MPFFMIDLQLKITVNSKYNHINNRNSHLINPTHSDQSSRQETVLIENNVKTDKIQDTTRSNDPMLYTGFWHRLFKKSKNTDNETLYIHTNISNDQQKKSNVQSDNAQTTITYQRTTNHKLPPDNVDSKSRPVSIGSTELKKNNPYMFERKHLSDYGHHQFQITSVSNKKLRLLRNHSPYQPNVTTSSHNNSNNNNNHITDNNNSSSSHSSTNSSLLTTTIQRIPEAELTQTHVHNHNNNNISHTHTHIHKRIPSKLDLKTKSSNLSRRESKSQNYLHLDASPKMRYVRKLHTFASVPDLTKKPIRSALKGSRNNSAHRSVHGSEQVVMSPNPLNSDSFSLTPPTPVELRHLVHFQSSDIPTTTLSLKPVNKTDLQKSTDSDWIPNKFDFSNVSTKISPVPLSIGYSKYSPELKRSHESNRKQLDFSINYKNNDDTTNGEEASQDTENLMNTSTNVDMSSSHSEMNDVKIVEAEVDNDDSEENFDNSIPKFHSKVSVSL
ncbi:unnamed protein product [Schistosoma turkestanicum]|nr:unnamed protein product [Schistosoma turkestanicum]